MMVKLFVLGCSGSGKSTAARYIVRLARNAGYSATRVNDYEILYEMFQADIEAGGDRFLPVDYGGFDVLDLSLYAVALMQVEQEVQRSYYEGNELIVIEFARDDYNKALRLFSDGFLRDAYFLFLDSDPDICIRRIHNRVIHPATIDDHFVPEHVIESFLHKENKQYIASHLKTDYGIGDEKVKLIDNTGASMSFFKEVTQLAESILRQELSTSRETEQLPKVSAPTSVTEPKQKAQGLQETEPIHIVTPIDEPTEL